MGQGDILVADQFSGGGAAIRVNPATGEQVTVSSGGGLANASDVVVDGSGDLLVVVLGLGGGGGVIRVNRVTGAQTVLSSGGNFAGDSGGPTSIALEANGDIVVTDYGLPGVIRVDPSTGAQSVVSPRRCRTGRYRARRRACRHRRGRGNFTTPWGITVDSNANLLVGDQDASPCGAIIRVHPTTGARAVVSSGGNFQQPRGVALESNGDILVVDANIAGGAAVVRVSPSTGAQTIVSQGGSLNQPIDVDVAANGDIFVVDTYGGGGFGSSGVIRVDPTTGAQTVVSAGGSLEYAAGGSIDPFPAPY
jgi:sugar lactone lactonase YvrE